MLEKTEFLERNIGVGQGEGRGQAGSLLGKKDIWPPCFFHIVTTIQGLEEKCRNLFHNTANRVAQMFTMSRERMHKIYRKKSRTLIIDKSLTWVHFLDELQ